MEIEALARRRWFYPAVFAISLAAFTAVFVKGFTGIHGDGAFYYSYAVSLLWDGDLDLRNQFDTPDPREPGKTYSRGLYSLDKTTGKAFSTYNLGAGLLMLPALAGGKLVDDLRGGRHPDPFDMVYQRLAGFTAAVISALTILLLISILRRYVSFGPALCLPFLFVPGSNWLFYASVFATWSHVYALFLLAATVWTLLLFLEKRNVWTALLFGLAGGLSFLTRNLSALTFAFLFSFTVYDFWKNRRSIRPGRSVALLALAGLAFFAGAAPQLTYDKAVHGSFFRTSWQAATEAPDAFGPFAKPDFRILEPAHLQFLYSNLANTDDGLFYCHPFYLIGLLGLIFLKPGDSRFRGLNNLLLANLFLFWFIDAAYFDNWFNRAAGAGFGHRRYLDMLPVFIFGAAGILEASRRRKSAKTAVLVLFAALTAAGAALLREFIAHYGAYYAARDSLFGLYGFLLGSPAGFAMFALVFLILLLLIRTDQTDMTGRPPWTLRKPLTVAAFAALFILPAFFFKPDASVNRRRFQAAGGSFKTATRTPLADFPGRDWGQPENGARPMRSSSAEIVLPAPLLENDVLLLKLTPLLPEGRTGGMMNVRMGPDFLGRFAVKAGRRVIPIRVPVGVSPGRTVSIQFENANPGPPAALLHEGRVVFRERDDPPFGFVDLPSERAGLGAEPLVFDGWALDDRLVAGIAVKREPFKDELNPPRDADGLVPLPYTEFKWKPRPDVENVEAVFPSMDQAGWDFRLARGAFPAAARGPVVIVVIAYDNKGQRTELGRKEIIVAGKS